MEWYLLAFKNYATFSGRARRKAYWMYILFNFLVVVVLGAIGLAVKPLIFLLYIYDLATIIPSLALFFRRMHDTGRSAGWFFIGLIPIVGWIILLVFLCGDSQPGPNQYGPNPKEAPVGYGQGYPAV